MNKIIAIFLLLVFFTCPVLFAQKNNAGDSAAPVKKTSVYKPGFKDIFLKKDSSKPYSPRIAILRSAVLPGWGQITNKKYWKLPLVYGALGITVGVFFHNVKQYTTARDAYINATDGDTSNDYQIPEPYHSVLSNPEKIRTFRIQVRQNVDYSVIFFLAFWGLNVADAAVDAHLKTFDVGDNLSLRIKAGYSELAHTNGLSLVLKFNEKKTGR